MKLGQEKTIIYSDELNDEFSFAELEHKPLSKKFVFYKRNVFWKIAHWFWNIVVARPISLIYAKIAFSWKVINKKAFQLAKKSSYFVYGNHTQSFFDASMPKRISDKDCYVIVNSDNLNIKGIGWLIKKLGALPLADDMANTKKLVTAIDMLVEDKKPVLIYPEAHIWPYYTKIRPFKSTSFRYPVKYNLPAFCFTNTYQKKGKKVKIVTYVDGPFYPNESLPNKERIEELRNRVYEKMVERSLNSNCEVIKYVRRKDD